MTAGTMSVELQPATRLRPYAAVRTLQIEAEGDFFHGLIKPKIRIMGRWLEQAGFRPGGQPRRRHNQRPEPGRVPASFVSTASDQRRQDGGAS